MTSHARSGRSEFTRIYLASLSRSAEREIDARLERDQLLRRRRAERRLEHIHRVAAQRGLPLPPPLAREAAGDGRGLVRVAAIVASIALAALIAAVAVDGPHGAAVEVADLAMLVTVTGWVLLALHRSE